MPNRRVRSFLTMLESLGELAWFRNIETNEMRFTPAFWETLGYSPDEAPTDRVGFSMLIHPGDIPHVQRESERFIAGESSVLNVEFRVRAKPKAWRWFQLRGREIQRRENGEAHIAAGIMIDVDDMRRSEIKALEDHERLTLAMQGSGAGLWELDLHKRVLMLDARSVEMHGFPQDLPMPMALDLWLNKVDPDHRFHTAAAFRKALEGNSIFVTEYSVDSGSRWINGFGKAILNQDGEPIRFVGLNFDVSERKRSENMIEQMRNELLHTSRVSAMGAMAATLAHELNQPLTAIANYSTGLMRIAADNDDDREMQAAQAIKDNAQRAGEIIRRMREMAKGENVRKDVIKFDPLVKEAAGYASAGCEGISFDLQLNDGVTVMGDSVQIQQVLINLIRNACQAMEKMEGTKQVTVTKVDLADAVQICVADCGSGIPKELMPNIFEANVTTKAEGMGIGLSISRTIVEAHGGKLWAENTGNGARFCFTLPIAGASG